MKEDKGRTTHEFITSIRAHIYIYIYSTCIMLTAGKHTFRRDIPLSTDEVPEVPSSRECVSICFYMFQYVSICFYMFLYASMCFYMFLYVSISFFMKPQSLSRGLLDPLKNLVLGVLSGLDANAGTVWFACRYFRFVDDMLTGSVPLVVFRSMVQSKPAWQFCRRSFLLTMWFSVLFLSSGRHGALEEHLKTQNISNLFRLRL